MNKFHSKPFGTPRKITNLSKGVHVKQRTDAAVSRSSLLDSARQCGTRLGPEKRSRFSNLPDMVVVPTDRQDAWSVFEEMLYEQDCRFSSGE
ncbi:MAG: hypothetical protein JXX29_20090 [Deltaproteobacteria bacterium]|nr:hypothetical protein [Deltaproteobacteria bacterium]MBN2673993.1 hypothetical protein [Deltaproteobacteria bacterium]